MTEAILEMRKITKEFPGVRALSEVDLTVERGEIHALVGENGAGKSTLMNVLSGVYPHGTYSGAIVFEGKVRSFRAIHESERAGIAIIHQELALIPYLSIGENIFLRNERAVNGVIDWDRTRLEASRLLELVGLAEDPRSKAMDISVGKQQLVEIAKALSKSVKVLVLDEPTASLNERDSEHLLELLRQLKAKGLTSILISHKLNEVTEVADSITILRDGSTIETLKKGGDAIDEGRIIKGMVGREIVDRFPKRTHSIGDVAFEVKDWNVYSPISPERRIVKDVRLRVRKGEVVGIAGLMGAGRTELAMSLFGRSYGARVSGSVFKDGRRIDIGTPRKAIERRVAYVTEDRKTAGLNLLGDVKENITIAALGKISPRFVIDRDEEAKAAEGYRRAMNIKTPSILQKVCNLSGGNQQKVVLSKWIFADPDVLILDEPTRGIDVGAKYEIYTIINALAGQGKAVIFISSELPEILGMSDRIYVMGEGRIVGELAREEATQESIMRCIMQGGRENAYEGR
jgi:putative multiple sugar transport system ATP-binding protein